MIPTSYTKDPNAKIQLTFDVSEALAPGDSIDSILVKIYDSAGQDVSTTLIHSSSFLGTNIYVTFKSGTNKANYRCILTINTTLGEILPDILKILARNI
jgi:hypothetical protein